MPLQQSLSAVGSSSEILPLGFVEAKLRDNHQLEDVAEPKIGQQELTLLGNQQTNMEPEQCNMELLNSIATQPLKNLQHDDSTCNLVLHATGIAELLEEAGASGEDELQFKEEPQTPESLLACDTTSDSSSSPPS